MGGHGWRSPRTGRAQAPEGRGRAGRGTAPRGSVLQARARRGPHRRRGQSLSTPRRQRCSPSTVCGLKTQALEKCGLLGSEHASRLPLGLRDTALGSLPPELGCIVGTRMGWGWPGGAPQPCGRKGKSQVSLRRVPQDGCDSSARRCAGPWPQSQQRSDDSAAHTDFTAGTACEQLLSARQRSCQPLCERLLL